MLLHMLIGNVDAPRVDPLEKEEDTTSLLVTGRWRVAGSDDRGNKWAGYLFLEHAPGESFLTRGRFEWHAGQTGGGTYFFAGEFDPTARRVIWTGCTVKDRVGRPCNAVYRAVLSPSGNELVDGTWSGGICMPGTWKAQFVGFE